MADSWVYPESASFGEVEAFVAAHPYESTILEYKDVHVLGTAGSKRKLVQDISALANSHGGIMILGVVGKDGSYSLQGFSRQEHARGTLRATVVNCCLDMTWPPLFVQPAEVESADGLRAAVLLRVEPRVEGPVFFHSEGESGCFECYVRADGRRYQPRMIDGELQRFTGIDLATDLPELQRRGVDAEERRSSLRRCARERSELWLREAAAVAKLPAVSSHRSFELCICPRFPAGVLVPRDEVTHLLRQWHEYMLAAHPTWFDEFQRTSTKREKVRDGCRFVSVEVETGNQQCHWLYTEATEFGVAYLRLGLPGYTWPDRSRAQNAGVPVSAVSCGMLATLSCEVLNLSSRLCERGGYMGPVSVRWKLEGMDVIDAMVMMDVSPYSCTSATWERETIIQGPSGDRSLQAAEVAAAFADLAWTFRATDSQISRVRATAAERIGAW